MPEPWPRAARPSTEAVRRRQAIAEAAAAGDPSPAKTALVHADDRVRASAVAALHRLGELSPRLIQEISTDDSHRVRRQLATAGAGDNRVDLAALIADEHASVCETACWAAGERASAAEELVGLLATIVVDHDDALCREAAVAALGSIGSINGLSAILAATRDRSTVRRRAILALAPFDTPEVAAALERALEDRDWQVRQAAEDLTDRQRP